MHLPPHRLPVPAGNASSAPSQPVLPVPAGEDRDTWVLAQLLAFAERGGLPAIDGGWLLAGAGGRYRLRPDGVIEEESSAAGQFQALQAKFQRRRLRNTLLAFPLSVGLLAPLMLATGLESRPMKAVAAAAICSIVVAVVTHDFGKARYEQWMDSHTSGSQPQWTSRDSELWPGESLKAAEAALASAAAPQSST